MMHQHEILREIIITVAMVAMGGIAVVVVSQIVACADSETAASFEDQTQ